MMKNAFITFEGIDGSGKTTQAKRLHAHFEAEGIDSVFTRDPGGTSGGEEIRNLIVDGNSNRWHVEIDIMLFTAARKCNDLEIVQPALSAGKTVICDRWVNSTRVYQSSRCASKKSRDRIFKLVNDLQRKMKISDPDAVVLLDMDPDSSFERMHARDGCKGRFESYGIEHHRKLRDMYLKLASDDPNRFIVVDADRNEDAVFGDVLSGLEKMEREWTAGASPLQDGEVRFDHIKGKFKTWMEKDRAWIYIDD